MQTTAYLTSEENGALLRRAKDLVELSGLTLSQETLSTFETPEQSRYRFEHCLISDSPGFRSIWQQVSKAATDRSSLQAVDFSKLSAKELQAFFSMIGATGVTALIELGIQTAASQQDLRAITSLTHVRHALLLSNAEFFRGGVPSSLHA